MEQETSYGFSGKRVSVADVRYMVAHFPAHTLRWTAKFDSGWYGGADQREYASALGANEIIRQIKCERSDRRGTGGRIYSETLTVTDAD